nr:hypothetical protein [Nanoarchaeum sp.]
MAARMAGWDGTPACHSSADCGGDACVEGICGGIVTPVCGNNITESGETCDDGNLINGDGCSSSCQTEIPICSFTSAVWSTTQVVNNTQVTLTVNGNNCDGETISFSILEDDGIAGTSDVTSQLNNPPTSTTFVSGVATKTWDAEWLQDSGVFTDDDPEYIFEAILTSNTSKTIQSSNILKVTPSVVNPCGNGAIDSGEQCDGSNLNGQTCISQDFGGGSLSCTNLCVFNTSLCTPLDLCGNEVINLGEVCDGSNLNDQTCALQGFDSGTLSCNVNCLSFNTNNCVNVECNINEDCEDGNVCTT